METKIEQMYEEWCGESRHINDCHPVHDSSETIEFAEYYHLNMKTFKMDLRTKLIEYNKTLHNWHDRISPTDMVLKAVVRNFNDDLTKILADSETSEKKALNIGGVMPCLSDVEITEKAIEYAKQFMIRYNIAETNKVRSYAVRDYYAGFKAATDNKA